MSQSRGGRPSREQSALKREAILHAARDLFVSEGVDRVSMDAVAAKAQVSKATVYDHFGDKQTLFAAILHNASSSMTATAQRVLDEHLSDDAPIHTIEELEAALTAAMIDLGDAMVGSDEYSAVFALVAQHRQRTSDPTSDVSTEVAEEAFAERIQHFVDLGLLDTDDPRTAADHFTALTVLLAYNQQPIAALVDPEKVNKTMTNGVRLFIRGYRAQAHE